MSATDRIDALRAEAEQALASATTAGEGVALPALEGDSRARS